MNFFFVAFFFLLLFHSFYSIGQKKSEGNTLSDQESIVKHYHLVTGEYSPLYTGLEYRDYLYTNIVGHQFYSSKDPQGSSINYDNVEYSNIPILYDLSKDEVIIIHDSSPIRTHLIKEKLNSFSITGERFIRISKGSLKEGPGIYNLIYDGRYKAIAKHSKKLKETVEDAGYIKREFIYDVNYYVVIEDSYFSISNKKSLLNLFDIKGKEIAKFLKKQNINFRRQKRDAIIASLKYYESK